MPKIISAERAAELIRDGSTIAASVFGMAGWAEEVGIAVEKRFLETGHPRDITLIHGAGAGDWKGNRGTSHFGHEGLTKRWIGGHTGSSPSLAKMVIEGKCEAYCFPQGAVVQLYREIAAKRPGVITKVGLGTFVDPRLEGGRLNSATKEDIVKVVEFEGEEWLFYKAFPIDVALIRGTTIDENGNLTMEREGVALEALPLAQAAKNSGGIVIAQVENVAKAGSLHPKLVKVPGVLIDYVVIAQPENHMQTTGTYFSPIYAGDIKVPLESVPKLPFDERLIIARRAAMELTPYSVVNLGIGVPEGIAIVAAEEGVSNLITLTTEVGGIGGIPAGGPNFGHAVNSEAIVDQHAQFDWYDGGGLDAAFLGLAQVDCTGNVNVSKFQGRAVGCGGFINITQNSKKVVFCGSFTAGGLEVAIKDGKLEILKEGKGKKFINQVEQVTFSGRFATTISQQVLYVTERAVFKLDQGELTLIEIAPGIDLQKDILAHMEFKPRVSSDLKVMLPDIFKPLWGDLATLIR